MTIRQVSIWMIFLLYQTENEKRRRFIFISIIFSEFDRQTYRPNYHEDFIHSEIEYKESRSLKGLGGEVGYLPSFLLINAEGVIPVAFLNIFVK